ncbi:MAG: RdgB/HAM1 family non-canonical purine NTP pyrophosphatase [Dehalococcoidia bacterium]|nr:RdgB/HAM1 family non-canonical purine NTP pyrophosphatase [Dehalococcoidia bacterium]MDH4367025.1 RdgB/HAM1 family non-canonical purine NTP pyrophosphatase [Dehalococcoidia bacterium]
MPKLLLATSNPGKTREYRLLLNGLGYEITTLADEGITKVVTESRNSYEQNARLKAITYAKLSQLLTLADDSGLEVDALKGRPGIKSARFAGKAATDADRVSLLLARLDAVPWEKRTARFKCVIAVATPEGQFQTSCGECHGLIALEAKGRNGFGYDPVFFLPEKGKTLAELPLKTKNQISHRARASHKARQILQQLQIQSARQII